MHLPGHVETFGIPCDCLLDSGLDIQCRIRVIRVFCIGTVYRTIQLPEGTAYLHVIQGFENDIIYMVQDATDDRQGKEQNFLPAWIMWEKTKW